MHPFLQALLTDYAPQMRRLLNQQSSSGDTPLHFAATRGSSKLAMLLMENGAEPTAFNAKSETPMCLAVEEGHLE